MPSLRSGADIHAMTGYIAALPMYDWRETHGETDAEWSRLRALLQEAGVDAPERLARRNADLPPVPGGIRDETGAILASDPASQAPDELDFRALWLHPQLLLAQTCWGPMEMGLERHVTHVGQPSYEGVEGGAGELYSSAILMRKRGKSVQPPADERSLIPLELLRGKRFAYNGLDSMSGYIAVARDLEALGAGLEIFPEHIVTGAHRASIVAVAQGRADVCAVDCLSWRLACLHEPQTADVEVVGWTGKRKGLPFITSKSTPTDVVNALRNVFKKL